MVHLKNINNKTKTIYIYIHKQLELEQILGDKKKRLTDRNSSILATKPLQIALGKVSNTHELDSLWIVHSYSHSTFRWGKVSNTHQVTPNSLSPTKENYEKKLINTIHSYSKAIN